MTSWGEDWARVDHSHYGQFADPHHGHSARDIGAAEEYHEHGWRELAGVSPEGHDHDYASTGHDHEQFPTWDEFNDRLRNLDREIDDNFAKDRHNHDEIGELGATVDDLADELRAAINELRGYSEALRDRMREVERNNAAIVRRMRAFEAALRITPPADDLTAYDEPPFPPGAPE